MQEQLVVSLDSPQVMEALADLQSLQRWEVLRRTQRAHGVAELSAMCGCSPKEMQASLDLLVDAGLLERRMASAKTPHITYRCPALKLLVGWNTGKAEHREFLAELRLRLRDLSRSLLDSHDASATPAPPRRFGTSVFANAMISNEDRLKLLKAAETIGEVFAAANARAEERARQGIPDPLHDFTRRATEGPHEPATETVWHYHLALEIRPLLHAVPPIPEFALFNADYVADMAARRRTEPASILTPRELEVAKRLAVGESRPFIAKSLGVTTNTIATTSKRIYAKLGVNNRAAIAARMSSG